MTEIRYQNRSNQNESKQNQNFIKSPWAPWSYFFQVMWSYDHKKNGWAIWDPFIIKTEHLQENLVGSSALGSAPDIPWNFEDSGGPLWFGALTPLGLWATGQWFGQKLLVSVHGFPVWSLVTPQLSPIFAPETWSNNQAKIFLGLTFAPESKPHFCNQKWGMTDRAKIFQSLTIAWETKSNFCNQGEGVCPHRFYQAPLHNTRPVTLTSFHTSWHLWRQTFQGKRVMHVSPLVEFSWFQQSRNLDVSWLHISTFVDPLPSWVTFDVRWQKFSNVTAIKIRMSPEITLTLRLHPTLNGTSPQSWDLVKIYSFDQTPMCHGWLASPSKMMSSTGNRHWRVLISQTNARE